MKAIPPDAQGLHIDPDGTRRWYLNGQLHRARGPAVIFPNGGKEWWRHGELHRQNGPAIERADGSREWWRKGRQSPGNKTSEGGGDAATI